MYDLTFDPEKYEIKTCELGNRSITYRAFEHIVYCANPASKIQTLNIYVPEEYYSGKTINGYSLNTAPIFAPNTVGGYMEGPAMEVGIDRFNHKPNSAFEALLHGYVVMCAGIRGRNTGMHSKEFFVGGTGKENRKCGICHIGTGSDGREKKLGRCCHDPGGNYDLCAQSDAGRNPGRVYADVSGHLVRGNRICSDRGVDDILWNHGK